MEKNIKHYAEGTTAEQAITIAFSSSDFQQMDAHGVTMDTVSAHLEIFRSGIPKAILERPATIGDGILNPSDAEFVDYGKYFDSKKDTIKLQKFVPASGAASRMFKFLNEFLNECDPEQEAVESYITRKKAKELTAFLSGLEQFPFFEALDKTVRDTFADFDTWEKDRQSFHYVKVLLGPDHFDFANKPKGVLAFHKYENYAATPIEEHLSEGIAYANSNNTARIHFTVSENHQPLFEKIIEETKPKFETQSGTKLEIDFTFQHKATDTIAVDLENNPFRDKNEKLVFRPGGHGALINNLNDLDADIVFIKNIDNVIQNREKSIPLYKKGLAGIVMELQQQVFEWLHKIENKEVRSSDMEEIISFLTEKLNVAVAEDFPGYDFEEQLNHIKTKLDRPIRACGMVKNEGEPGGGPFWIRDSKENVSLQIVETSQVDTDNPDQAKILAASTHFNPVDLVCAITDFKGNKFDLTQFTDPESGFIVYKNSEGRDLKSYELPGLWNGAMANWITVFVEVPLVTFNPVKTVNDLLKPAHQPE